MHALPRPIQLLLALLLLLMIIRRRRAGAASTELCPEERERLAKLLNTNQLDK